MDEAAAAAVTSGSERMAAAAAFRERRKRIVRAAYATVKQAWERVPPPSPPVDYFK